MVSNMFKIVEYTDKYKEKVVELLSEIILKELEMNENIEDIKNYDYNNYKNNGGNFWIAIDENDNVKATTAIQNDLLKKEARLARVYLDKDYRGSGIATEMLNLAIDFVKGLEYNKIILGTYQKLGRAIRFYEKHGFKEYELEDVKDDTVKFYALDLEVLNIQAS